MKSNRVFRWVWRLNALLFLACSLIFITGIGIALYPTIRDFVRRKPVYSASDMVNIEDNVKLNSEWSLGGFSQITGTDYVMSSVHSKQEYNVGIGSEKEASATRNYLFLNSTDKTTLWLVPTNFYLFLSDYEIKENESSGAKVLAIRYNLVKDDTNKDRKTALGPCMRENLR